MRSPRPIIWPTHILGPFARIIRRELALFVSLGIAAGALWAFAELADAVIEREVHAIDRALLLMLRDRGDPADPLGPGWLEELVRDVTALGSNAVLTFLTLAVAGFLILQRKARAAVLVLVAIGGGLLLAYMLKFGFDRPRPDLVPHGATVYTASFPSAHAMMATITYLTLGALLARVQPNRILKLYFVSLAVLLTIAVGISRVYLGVHWPTDVLAGWTIGAAWAAFCWSVALWLQRRGQMDTDRPAGAADPAR